MQTWRIHWVRDAGKKASLVTACLSQGAARTAQELLVFTCNPNHWKVSQPLLLDLVKDHPRKDLLAYYGKLMPFIYGYKWLSPLKWLAVNLAGLFRPMVRGVATGRDRRETCVKSTALACENFMLAIAAQGFDTCPMEGFDEVRVRRILDVACSETIVMVISVGERAADAVIDPQYRIPRNLTVREI